ncbi:hypothetical protein PtB15_5B276 [Puccinia triticina]|nr:hypothetical protein PtB15_5B276 [Puccinia triticina]
MDEDGTTISCPRSLLDKVDEIRKLGLASTIPLPQIAVVGDQSSGKSALLEYISGVTFPKDAGMCTCFVTQVMMRSATEFSARVLVNGEVHPQLKAPQSRDDVAAVIENAKALFKGTKNRSIYDEILTVELNGPELPMLTLVDLPGYVHTHAVGQSETIVQEIAKLVETYIAEPRTIVLAVIPANHDFVNNVAISYIRRFDEAGKRTLCVLTKPDLLDRGTEGPVFEILSGKLWHLSRGYHIIKNKGYEDCRAGDPREGTLKKESAFFERPPWSSIPVTQRGIQSLIEKLTDTLTDQVEKELSGIRKDIIQRKETLSAQLEALGPAIATDLEKSMSIQRNINHVMQQFKYLVDGHYGAGDFSEEHYLRSLVRDYNEAFHKKIIAITNQATESLDIRSIMRATRGRELKGMVPLEAFVILCKRVVEQWLSVTQGHIAKVCQIAMNTLAQVIGQRCDQILVNYFSERMMEFVHQQKKIMDHDAHEVLDDEINQPSTLQDTDFAKKWGVEGSAEDVQMRTILRSYCLTAASRYVDAICLYVVERRLFKNCDERGIKWFTNDPTALSRFREPRQTAKLRESLPVQIQQLEAAIARL